MTRLLKLPPKVAGRQARRPAVVAAPAVDVAVAPAVAAVPDGSYQLVIPGRVSTVNGQRTVHFHERAAHDAGWRAAAWGEAKEQRVPHLGAVDITAQPFLRHHQSQDVAACLPSVKAAIDGLVDAGVLDDDTPAYVRSLTFLAPVLGCERDDLVLTLTP